MDITKFTFKSFRILKKRLGEFDAVVECNEIAIREFTEQVKNSNDLKKYIQDLSLKHKVRVNEVDLLKFSSRIRQFYILSVTQQGEQFLEEFETEFKEYFPAKDWQPRNSSETLLENILINVYGNKIIGIQNITEGVFEGYEYYRLIRNRVAHSENYNIAKIKNKHQEAIRHLIDLQTKYHLNGGLNEYTKIDYSDFLLITNIIKNIGYVLCQSATPDNQQIAKILLSLKNKKGNHIVSGILKIKNNENRFKSAIFSLLRTNFGRISSKDKEEILQEVTRLLA
ncbi:MAG: hypothetical protein H6577_24165 [Lewinellaceae bacterium]|nr:hypothetical protein [Saprospiraceae bacterium]MCB9341230.1 hypothetical protein [Lewinellaceae bacterium]